jgi:hypothetical protein
LRDVDRPKSGQWGEVDNAERRGASSAAALGLVSCRAGVSP